MQQSNTVQSHTAGINRGKYFRTFILFLLLFALFTKQGAGSWNDISRMAQIQSLIEHHSFRIDGSQFFDTGDKYFFDNHFYSDKPPILALYAAPFYLILRGLGCSFESHPMRTYYLLTLLSIGALSALGLTVFRKMLTEFLDTSDEWADLVAFIAGTGTLILPYSLLFNNHVPSGVLILIGVYYLFSFGKNRQPENAAYSGLFLSLAGSIDINCFLFLPFVLMLFLRKSVKAGLFFAISCLPVIALYLGLNLYTSGSLMPPAMNASLWNYPGSAFNQENLSGLAKHQNISDVLFYAFHMLLGSRGLISHTPLLLVSGVALFRIYQKNYRFQYRGESGYLLAAILMYLGIYILRTTNYSGWAFGVRWFASLMLIACLPIASLESEFRSSKRMRFFFVGITCLSILFSIIGTHSPFTPVLGSDLQEQINPTNTLFASVQRIFADSSPTASTVRVKLILGTFIIYGLLYRLIKNLRFDRPRLDRPNPNY